MRTSGEARAKFVLGEWHIEQLLAGGGAGNEDNVTCGEAEDARRIFARLMGKAEAAGRREWMERDGNAVEVDI